MSPEISQIRRDICADCTRDCEVRASINITDPCAQCPYKIWHHHASCDPDNPYQFRGIGDAIAIIANPIAKVFKINPKKCGCHGPSGRQSKLNKLLPFK